MSMEEFKEFVKEYPKLKFDVRDNKKTWQQIYDEWKILGNDGSWDKYKDSAKEALASVQSQETLRTVLNFAKKIKPETITNVLSTAQKVLGLVQGMKTKGDAPKQDSLFSNNFSGWD